MNDAKTKLRNKKRYRVFEINFDKITKWSSAKQNFNWFADLVDLDYSSNGSLFPNDINIKNITIPCAKIHIFLFEIFWKDVLPHKNCTGLWVFLYYNFFINITTISILRLNFMKKTKHVVSILWNWKTKIEKKYKERKINNK